MANGSGVSRRPEPFDFAQGELREGERRLNSKTLLRTAAGTLRAPWRLVFFAVALIMASVLLTLVVGVLAGKVSVGSALSAETLASIVDVIATLGATWVALRWIDRKPWSEVGLDRTARNQS